MNFRPQNHEEPEVNLTPLIDVVFLLLIFFMITTTFQRHAELKIDLPDAESAEASEVKSIEVVIDREGRFFVEGNELVNTQPETLSKALSGLAKDKNTPLIVRADALTPHQAVVTVMDVAGRLGMSRLSIATTQNTP